MEQLVARQAHNLEVARSSPASATNTPQLTDFQSAAVFLFMSWTDIGSSDKYGGLFIMGQKRDHPINIGDCLAWVRKRHHILAKPNDKSGMTLKPCTSARFQHNLKIRNILDTTKNSSASCVFIICLLK